MIALRNSTGKLNPYLEDYLGLTVIAGGVAFVGAMFMAVVFSLFNDVTHSAWNIVSQIAVWYVGTVSGIVLFSMLAMYVSHGGTRRHAFKDWLLTAGSVVLTCALMMSIGYPLERLVYRLFDFPGRAEHQYIFADPEIIATVFLQMLIVFAVWAAIGGMVAAAVYRYKDTGWLMIAPALLLLSLAGVWVNRKGGFLGFLRRIIKDFDYQSDLVTTLIAVGVAMLATLIAWGFSRSIPLRNK